LLTLLGTGGLGKTRLSLQLAADLLESFPDGVWLIELAPLSDPELVAQAAASVLGVREQGGETAQAALAKYVKDRRLLLILDNCEHLSRACAMLATALLKSGPGVKILASSRERLHEPGEATYHVPPLAIPDDDRTSPPAALTECDSVRLFCERAAAAQHSFQVTERNAQAVAAICRRLDGIPLALELAAARVRSVPIEKIAERLSDRFHVLTGGSRSALPRQQTLRACIDWSFNLLAEQERVLMRRLSAFAGGFSLEAAESVGAGGDIAESQVLELLSQLVDKSLVELDAEGQRYRMLETVREYAHALLLASPEAADVRTRHLQFYSAMAEEADTQLRGPNQHTWLARMDMERENVLEAHAWCGASDTLAERGLQLAIVCHFYFTCRGMVRLAFRMTVEALARPGAQARTLVRCRALYAAGDLAAWMGRGEAQAYSEESLAIARELGDKDRIAAALVLLGTIFNDRGHRPAARRCFEESLVLSEELGDATRLANVLGSLAVLHGSEGNFDVAENLFEKSLTLARRHGRRNVVAANLCNLAIVSSRRGSLDSARARLLEALTTFDIGGSRALGRAILDISAGIAASSGLWTHAARYYGAYLAESERSGFAVHRGEDILAPLIAQSREVLGEDSFDAAQTAGFGLDYETAIAEVRTWLSAGRAPP